VAHEDFALEVEELKRRYGVPKRVEFQVEMDPGEFGLVLDSVRKGRRHDVTLFIRYGDKFVVIEKHAYAKTGIVRAPSGGARPRESLVEAAKREAWEETGLEIELEHFVLESHVRLTCQGYSPVDWVSYVFLAKAVGGKLEAHDRREISDVQLRSREELLRRVRPLMISSGSGGLRYRALLTDAFFAQLDALGIRL